MKTQPTPPSAPPADSRISRALRQALEMLPNLDIPAKGRIAHHIRTGRLNRALALCANGHAALWQNVWERNAPVMLDQLRLLRHVEILLQGAMRNNSLQPTRGTF